MYQYPIKYLLSHEYSRLLRSVMVVIGYLVCSTTVIAQSDATEFNNAKWLESSEYRYQIIKSDVFPDVTDLSTEKTIELLGVPDCINENKFTYCLDIPEIKNLDNKKSKGDCHCKSSFITIDFEIDKRWKLTIIWKE